MVALRCTWEAVIVDWDYRVVSLAVCEESGRLVIFSITEFFDNSVGFRCFHLLQLSRRISLGFPYTFVLAPCLYLFCHSVPYVLRTTVLCEHSVVLFLLLPSFCVRKLS